VSIGESGVKRAVSFDELLDILYEDNHCIAVNKPCGWPSAHYDGCNETVDRLVKSYLKEKYKKPGKVFLGVVHRLDRPVSGVLLFAKTSKGAARLSEQFRENAVEKIYWGVVETDDASGFRARPPLQEMGSFSDWLRKDEEHHRVNVVDAEAYGAKQAVVAYRKKAEHGDLALLELRPQTGRRHQLRVQLAERGYPIFGDEKYGSRYRLGNAIGLHARALTFLHPIRYEPITLTAEVPKQWRGTFAYLLHPEAT
jgi:23S rRNA pseudouridine1911/1915/1917 synthase